VQCSLRHRMSLISTNRDRDVVYDGVDARGYQYSLIHSVASVIESFL